MSAGEVSFVFGVFCGGVGGGGMGVVWLDGSFGCARDTSKVVE